MQIFPQERLFTFKKFNSSTTYTKTLIVNGDDKESKCYELREDCKDILVSIGFTESSMNIAEKKQTSTQGKS